MLKKNSGLIIDLLDLLLLFNEFLYGDMEMVLNCNLIADLSCKLSSDLINKISNGFSGF